MSNNFSEDLEVAQVNRGAGAIERISSDCNTKSDLANHVAGGNDIFSCSSSKMIEPMCILGEADGDRNSPGTLLNAGPNQQPGKVTGQMHQGKDDMNLIYI